MGLPGAAGVSSPVIFLLPGQASPAGYAFVGSFEGTMQGDTQITLLIYQKW